VRLRKRLVTSVLGLLAGTTSLGLQPEVAARESVWRASRPLRVAVEPPVAESPRPTGHSEAATGEAPWQDRADRLRQLRAGLKLVRVDIDYLEGRLQSYRVFRFSDAMIRPIAQTQAALSAARIAVSEIEAEIRRVNQSR
jgi:hypothetical protein